MNAKEPVNQTVPASQGHDIVASANPASPCAVKRNFTVVMALLAAGTGAAAIFSKHGAQSVQAATVATPAQDALRQKPATEIASFPAEHSPIPIDDIVAKIRFSPAEVQVPLSSLKCDPFQTSAGGTQARLLPDDPAEIQRREQERQAALEAVQSLHLESVQRDESHRECTINGMLYQEGQDVDGFVIEEIATSAVVVRKSVYRFELRVR